LDAARVSGIVDRHASGLADRYRAQGHFQPDAVAEIGSVTHDEQVLSYVAQSIIHGGRADLTVQIALNILARAGVDLDEARRLVGLWPRGGGLSAPRG
jgi:hypothetical protein